MSNSLDPDQDWHFVRPGLGPNCLFKLPADNEITIFLLAATFVIG